MHTPQNRLHVLVKLGAILTLGVGGGLFLVNLYLWMCFRVNIPVTDQADILPLMQTVVEGGFFSTSVFDWIAPISGAHRIAVTRLLMSIDYLFLNGQNHLIYFSTWASILTVLAVILNTFRISFASEKALLLFVAGMTLAFLSSRSQLWNLVNPINSSWYITFAASALSFACITSKPQQPTAWQIFAAYSLAAVAAFSTFSGVLVWLILPLLIAIRSTRSGIATALISAVFLVLYLSEISTDVSLHASELTKYLASKQITVSEQRLHVVFAVSKNTLIFLGSPLSITKPKPAALAVTASMLIILVGWLSLLRSWHSGRFKHNAWIQLNLAIATLCVGTAIAANLGRLILSTPTADRYQTIVMMYWLCICGLILGFGARKYEAKPLGQLAYMTLCVTVSSLFLANSSFPITTSMILWETANRASALDAFGISGRYLYLSAYHRGYLEEFHTFFENNKLAHRASDDLQIRVSDSSADCSNVQLSIRPTEWPGIWLASANIGEDWVNWNRKVPLSTAQGDVMGYLFPHYGYSKTETTPFFLRKSTWMGYLDSTFKSNQRVYLHYRSFTLADSSCGISSVRLKVE